MSAVHDELKGQVPVVFDTLKQSPVDGDARAVAAEMQRCVTDQLGAVARRWLNIAIRVTCPRWMIRAPWTR